ncbi:MAG: class I SAM-dependent methyltransferase [Euryarchaeota archaeon]|nr:class I SAM-dependent methyltransferase [Euryarchaeota archaeon]MDE1836359.1 class I SAM-dependent methyltransferase [Euryarchaeota archaeon]MDE1879157.1 class I SAM-dependent methyltransferase [Euryarchaeota archaeon]MDE2044245.1 class I SAM-dependent methyltransferase [Thermoplasmata archaeon]
MAAPPSSVTPVSTNETSGAGPTPQEKEATSRQLLRLQDHAAGFFAVWTLDLGLRHRLFEVLSKHPEGLSAEFLARELDLDRLYVTVWCNAAYSAEYVEYKEGKFYLAEGLKAPLLEPDSPVYFGGTAVFLGALRSTWSFLHEHLSDGENSWWDQFPPELPAAQADSSRTFYTRLLRKGFARVPGLLERLSGTTPVTFVELACGRGSGLVRMAQAFPNVKFQGIEGDEKSLKAAKEAVERAGLSSRVTLGQAVLERGPVPAADIVLLNIALHEAQDKEAVVRNAAKALRPKGTLLVSEFPFPDWGEIEKLRTPAGRVMAGVQYLEGVLGDQLLPSIQFESFLRKAGLREVTSAELAPIHVLVWGTK